MEGLEIIPFRLVNKEKEVVAEGLIFTNGQVAYRFINPAAAVEISDSITDVMKLGKGNIKVGI